MTPISDELLIQFCLDSVQRFYNFDYWAGMLFDLMHNTGIRYVEGYELTRWTDNEDGTFTLDTAKNSNNRIILNNLIPVNFQNLIRNEETEFSNLRYKQSTRYFNRYFIPIPLYHGSKRVTTHIYRYNIVKKMYLDDWNYQQIATWLGEVEVQNIIDYQQAIIYTFP